jgi:hypothetical protein
LSGLKKPSATTTWCSNASGSFALSIRYFSPNDDPASMTLSDRIWIRLPLTTADVMALTLLSRPATESR